MANLDVIRGRSTVLSLTNQSGAPRSPGDLVVIDTANDESFTVSTSSNTKVPIGIVDETIGIGSNGRVVVEGYARYVKTLGTSARGDFLFHSTTSATAAHMAGTTATPGAFGYVEDGGAGTATTAYIFPTTPTFVSQISHASNTFTGPVIFTASGTAGITMPAAGTLNFSASGAAGGGGGSGITFSTVGYTTAGGSFETERGLFLKAVTPASGKLLVNINAYIRGDGSAVGMCIPVIYDDNAGAPGKIIVPPWPSITSTPTRVIQAILNTTARWVTMPVNWKTNGNQIWIGVWLSPVDSVFDLAYDGSGSDYRDISDAQNQPVDASITAPSSTTNKYSIYADVIA